MHAKPLVVKPTNRSSPLNVVGVQISVLASGADGSPQVTVRSGGAGLGPPPHRHGWSETFFVLKGSVEFTCAGETTMCEPGTLVHVPAGTVHAFGFGAGGGEMLEFTGEGSHAVAMFGALAALSPEAGAPDLAKTVEILRKVGVDVAAA